MNLSLVFVLSTELFIETLEPPGKFIQLWYRVIVYYIGRMNGKEILYIVRLKKKQTKTHCPTVRDVLVGFL